MRQVAGWAGAVIALTATLAACAERAPARVGVAAPADEAAGAGLDAVLAHGAERFTSAGCNVCHQIDGDGDATVGPALGSAAEPFAARVVGPRAARPEAATAFDYALEAIVDPDAYVVEGYMPGVMKRVDEPPRSLTDADVIALAAFVASRGDAAAVRDVSHGDAAIARVRLARTTRVLAHRAHALRTRLRWDTTDPQRGATVFGKRCSGCHGAGDTLRAEPPCREQAPDRVADWVLAWSSERESACLDFGRADDLRDVCAWLAAPQ